MNKCAPNKFSELERLGVSDVVKLQLIAIKTFTEAFAHDNTSSDFKHYLQKNMSQEVLLEELSNPNSFFYAIPSQNGFCAYLKLNIGSAQTEQNLELEHSQALEIERIYVLNEYIGKGLGKQLFQFALAKAKELSKPCIWLGVWEKNTKAIDFYQRQGLEIFDSHTFLLGYDEQRDLLMKCEVDIDYE